LWRANDADPKPSLADWKKQMDAVFSTQMKETTDPRLQKTLENEAQMSQVASRRESKRDSVRDALRTTRDSLREKLNRTIGDERKSTTPPNTPPTAPLTAPPTAPPTAPLTAPPIAPPTAPPTPETRVERRQSMIFSNPKGLENLQTLARNRQQAIGIHRLSDAPEPPKEDSDKRKNRM
ncbi:MAG: hypothetical protein AB7V32_11505, partial [Candidatus Berkiella sp.]